MVMEMEEEMDVERMGHEEDRVGILISSRSSSSTTGSGSGIREPLLVKNSRLNTTSQHAIVGANVCPIESLDYESVLSSSVHSFSIILIF